MKLLLTGCHGQLGFELQRSLAPLAEVVAVGSQDCDLADVAAVRALVAQVNPQGIINAAAYTAVDKAETEQQQARKVNTEAPQLLGELARQRGAWVMHYSTDYVFAGQGSDFYRETDDTDPQSVYGLTKRDGERALLAACPQSMVMRTSWVVGAVGQNFAKTMLRLAQQRPTLSVVADQFGAPTSAALLADVTAHVVRRLQQQGADHFPFGLYHVAAGGVTNWHAYAQFVLTQAAQAGLPLQVAAEAVQAISSADYPVAAKRPANSRLDTQKFQSTFQLRLPDWQVGVSQVLAQLLQGGV